MTDDKLVEAWIRYQHKEDPDYTDPDFFAIETFMDLVDENPERLYALVEKAIAQTDDEMIWAQLGASPIEDLICQHGEDFVDRILDNARKDPRWRFAVGCVWPMGATNAAVKERVTAAIWKYYPNGTP